MTPPNVGNYAIGKGKLYIGDWQVGTITYAEMGNCPSVECEPAVERLEHFSSQAGLRQRDAYPVVQATYTVNFECDEAAAVNLKRFLMGTQVGNQIRMLQNPNAYFSLKFVSDNPIGPNYRWVFHKCVIAPNGAMALIKDEWMSMAYTAEGLADNDNAPTSPYATITVVTTTTTSTSSSTTTTTTA
jgi:hypothetical protein